MGQSEHKIECFSPEYGAVWTQGRRLVWAVPLNMGQPEHKIWLELITNKTPLMRAASCVFPHFWHFGDTAKLSCGVTASKCKSIIFEWNSLLISLFNKHRWGWIAKSVISWVYDTQMVFMVTPTDFRGGGVKFQQITPGWDLGRFQRFYGRGVKFQQITPGLSFYDPLVTHQDAGWPTVLERSTFAGLKLDKQLDFTIWEYNFRDILWNFDESVWFGLGNPWRWRFWDFSTFLDW